MKTVLLVEDDEAFRYAASRVLAQAGLRVLTAKGSMEALRMIDAERPDILLTDIRLPPGQPHGVALGRMARNRYPSLPIIYVTAYPNLLDSEDSRALAGKVMQKPIDLPELLAAVQAALT